MSLTKRQSLRLPLVFSTGTPNVEHRIYPQITQITQISFSEWSEAFRVLQRICETNQQLLAFSASFHVPKGPKLIAVGERLCAKPTGAKQTS